MLTIPEVAAKLGVTRDAVNKLVSRGVLIPSGKLGRMWYFTLEDFAAYKPRPRGRQRGSSPKKKGTPTG